MIATKEFYFIMANYFIKTDDGNYVPAELAIVKFNFTEGVTDKYHIYLNPGKCSSYFFNPQLVEERHNIFI